MNKFKQGQERKVYQCGYFSGEKWTVCGWGLSAADAKKDLENKIIEYVVQVFGRHTKELEQMILQADTKHSQSLVETYVENYGWK